MYLSVASPYIPTVNTVFGQKTDRKLPKWRQRFHLSSVSSDLMSWSLIHKMFLHIRKTLLNISYIIPALDRWGTLQLPSSSYTLYYYYYYYVIIIIIIIAIFQVSVKMFVDVDCRSQFKIDLSLIQPKSIDFLRGSKQVAVIGFSGSRNSSSNWNSLSGEISEHVWF